MSQIYVPTSIIMNNESYVLYSSLIITFDKSKLWATIGRRATGLIKKLAGPPKVGGPVFLYTVGGKLMRTFRKVNTTKSIIIGKFIASRQTPLHLPLPTTPLLKRGNVFINYGNEGR